MSGGSIEGCTCSGVVSGGSIEGCSGGVSGVVLRDVVGVMSGGCTYMGE